eukprot:768377-Hanusia_phi.AAC.4
MNEIARQFVFLRLQSPAGRSCSRPYPAFQGAGVAGAEGSNYPSRACATAGRRGGECVPTLTVHAQCKYPERGVEVVQSYRPPVHFQ